MTDHSPAPADTPAVTTDGGSADAPGAGAGRGRIHTIDVVALSALALLLRLPSFFSPRHLTFDDGVFASSALAMRDGGVPFRDVFSSQGPLFLPLVWLGDLLGWRTLDAPRVLAVGSGVVVVIGCYWVGTRLTDRTGALLAGVLAATSGCLMWVTSPLAADGPALAFAVLAFGLALSLRDRPRLLTAGLLGLAVGACLSTKAMEAPILAPVGLVLLAPLVEALRGRTGRTDRGDRGEGQESPSSTPGLAGAVLQALVAGACALGVFVVISAPFGFADVWDQSFRYRTDAASDRDIAGNAAKLLSTLWDRDLVLILFCVLAVLSWLLTSRSAGSPAEGHGDDRARRSFDGDGWLVWSWLAVTTVWLVAVVSPLWRPHVSAMVPPLVLAVAWRRPTTKLIAVGAVISLPLLWIQLDGLLTPGDYEGSEAVVVAALRDLPEGAWVLSDEPGLAWRADRRTTDDMVDPSMLRVQQGRYTEATLAAEAALPEVCAVVVRSDERFGSFEGLPDRLDELGYEVREDFGDGQVLYVRTSCSP